MTDFTENIGGSADESTHDPVKALTPIVGRKWHTVIIHRLLTEGPMGFTALEGSIEGISAKVLSNCLDDLESKGIITRRIVREKPFRVEYSLTALGRSLEPVITTMEIWGDEQIARVPRREDAVVSVPR